MKRVITLISIYQACMKMRKDNLKRLFDLFLPQITVSYVLNIDLFNAFGSVNS